MKRAYILITILATLFLAAPAQQRKTAAKKRANTTSVARKKTTTKKKSNTTKKKSTTGKKEVSINGLKKEQENIKKNIREQERKLRTNERDVKKRLQNLMVINTEIEDKRKTIDTIRRDISKISDDINMLDNELKGLQEELADRKQKYVKSMRYMHRNRSIQNQLMFIFSARNFSQMYRRLRFTREYAAYQRAQGEAVKLKQQQVEAKHAELTNARNHKSTLLTKGETEKKNLEGKQVEQQNVVSTLKKQQKTIQSIIDKQRKRDAAINEQIDRLIAIEIEKARQRAIAEAKRKAEAEAARKRAEEQARMKTEQEAAQKSGNKQAAEAKAEERKDKRPAKDVAKTAKKETTPAYNLDSEDRRISGSFESNRGRLPMPITGGYKIVSHFGQYNVEGLPGVTLDNKGINILGGKGAQARSIFDGEVSAVFDAQGSMGVIVRHGSYISVYCNLSSVSVRRGQHVTTRQSLGTVGSENILQFQLRREKAKLNPEAWLGR